MSPKLNITPVRKKPRWDFSVTGLVYCAMMMLMGLAAINGQANLLFGVFGLMIGVLLVSGVICRMVLSRLRLTRTLPEYCVVGRPTTLMYHFKNHKRIWPSLSATLAELEGTEAFETQPVAYMLHAAAQMTASVPVEVMPKRRGRHVLGAYQLSTSFPFGFIKRAVVHSEPDAVLVCPALGKVSKQLLSLCRSDQRADAPIKARRGGEDEFYGVKEHRTGDNPRWIYWRRSARTPGLLVSKEMTQVAPPRLVLLVDTYLQRISPPEQAAVEKALAMAASLASQALDDGLSVGLCAWNGDDWTVLTPQQGKRQLRDLLATLARLPPNTVADSAALLDTAAALIKTGTAAVLFTPRPMQLSLGDRLRGALVALPTESALAKSWFQFDPAIDFSRCVPVDDKRPGRSLLGALQHV
jgi:uncharacterized protein (DUF58 family)